MTKKKEPIEEPIEEVVEEAVEEVTEEPGKEPVETPAVEDPVIGELKDKLLRLTAEYDNYRKRTTREKEMLYESAKADTVAAFLPLFDNIEKAIAAKPENADGVWKAFSDGVDLMKKQMADILDKLGAEAIDAVGEAFDPELHNAVMHIDDDTFGENVVAEEFQKGFKLGDRVIRHSVVKVAN